MPYTIGHRFRFEAAHQLDQLPTGHKCRDLHGHSYKLEVRICAEDLDEVGFVVDFGVLKAQVQTYVIDYLDHAYLNQLLPVHPTAENLAKNIYDVLWKHDLQVAAVRVWETEDAWAEYAE